MTKRKNKKFRGDTRLLEVYDVGSGGDLVARPADGSPALRIYVASNKKIKPPLEIGDCFLGRVKRVGGDLWAKPFARTSKAGGETEAEKIFGVVERRGNEYYLRPSQKNARLDYLLDDIGKCRDGDFVAAMLIGERKFKQARIFKNYGPFDLNKAVSCLVLDKYGIGCDFPEAVGKETARCPKFSKKGRADLTSVPLVTIDGDDSKDFDDAVYAERTASGFNLIVAIADVAFYVRPGSALDREAYRRGNSVYLPNMVVPMLPEKLSNDLC